MTGTPLENRIDDLYSLVELIDPTIFGSLFRFNRNFYRFDSDGKVAGLQNLKHLHELLEPIMLRRRKDEVEDDLPPRTDRNLFVKLTDEQQRRYQEYADRVARLLHQASRRPLRTEEFERLQQHLACMRMLCDSCYILDDEIQDSPKVDEFMELLYGLQKDAPERKVIVFSEWTRMLELVAMRLRAAGIGYALHIGSIPQKRRREEIARFKNQPECHVFLSSDSGGVGLNLQAASVVVNLDLPWNPAKLNQRIARAWRKFQKNCVTVFNMVGENTIEHRMLGTLSYKSGLSDVVLDARGDATAFQNSDARQAFVKKLQELMAAKPAEPSAPLFDPAEILRKNNPGVRRLYAIQREGGPAYLCVGTASAEACSQLLRGSRVTCIAPETFDQLAKLRELGVVTMVSDRMKLLFEADAPAETPDVDPLLRKRLALARKDLADADRKAKMAILLQTGDFLEEALQAAAQTAGLLAQALHRLLEDPERPLTQLAPDEVAQVLTDERLDEAARQFLRLGTMPSGASEKLLGMLQPALDAVRKFIEP
ncbi:MAG: DEAD/DEAH box helicase [Victivallales bacterium]|nr:DEAD/DEAH box helicase [Victivallales bacterium]